MNKTLWRERNSSINVSCTSVGLCGFPGGADNLPTNLCWDFILENTWIRYKNLNWLYSWIWKTINSTTHIYIYLDIYMYIYWFPGGWFQIFFIFTANLGEDEHFDWLIFLNWVGSTTNYIFFDLRDWWWLRDCYVFEVSFVPTTNNLVWKRWENSRKVQFGEVVILMKTSCFGLRYFTSYFFNWNDGRWIVNYVIWWLVNPPTPNVHPW